ncbi:D-3-phosphoglycerate dehydrogenase [Natronolimnobius sp. AArcel1]|uniref:NAD(P)-dependent oxidoreductase n=1 Tax=Natronolimnobius sp. AArcel1 TaxID=1679093 RepID=UPI0013E9C847|nr:NAD(P)-dependent oxidoreductase [Natronolimnobius sp. AArcel1]NGM71299.1 D-3-phosphoglycerate dehydrogenase [Natronolimnobius sp. AArcel1]
MVQALVDQDIKPREILFDVANSDVNIEIGVENTETALVDALTNKEVLITSSRLPVTKRVLESASELELIAKIGTGLDSVDLEAAAENDTTVVYTPGLNALSVAEHALSLLLTVNRNVFLGQQALENGNWRDSMPTSRPVTQQTVGIIGFGNVGSRVAGLLDGFNAEVLVYDPYVHEVDTQITGTELVSLDHLLTESDAIIVTAELTEETRGMIGKEAFEKMSPEATIVNTARGPIVDQSALVEAIRNESIAGAGLDVFETEPLPVDSLLHEYANIVVTPHIGASTDRSRRATIETLIGLVNTHTANESVPERFVAVDAEESN